MKLLGTKCYITKEKNGENVPYIKITKLVLVPCINVNNNYQKESGILYQFISNILFLPKNIK